MAGQAVNGAAAPEEQDAGTAAVDVAAALRRFMLAYERYDARWRQRYSLNGNEKLVLLLIADGHTTTPSELSRAIGMTSAGMTNLLDRLEHEGYVNRERHATDRRRVLLTLTKRGLNASLGFEAVYGEILAGLDECDAPTVTGFLRAAAQAFHADADAGSIPER